jgi:hypothetical protein
MKKGALLELLETVLVVTVITVLIWLYAEGETIRTETRTISVRFVAPTTGLAITVVGQEPGTTTTSVEATLQASRGDWDRITEWARNETVEIEVSAPESADEEQTLNLLDALNSSPLADVRAFVKEVSPRSVAVRVQTLETIEMGLRVDPGELELSAEEPTFSINNTPIDTIQVELPTEDARLVRDLNLKLVARLDELDDVTLAENTQNKIPVNLSLPPELQDKPYIKLARNSVDVTFIVDKLTEQIELPRVQVRLSISDDITGQYRIRIDPDTNRFIKVTLKGPEEAISRIKEEPDLVRASIILKLSDLQEDAPHAAPLYIDVPEGVTVVSPEPTQTTITYTVTDLAPQP